MRGQKYVFDNTVHNNGHPLEIRDGNGGSAYTSGVSGGGTATITFTVPMDAPIKLYYQCINHPNMGNIIYIPLDSIDTTMALNLSNNLVVNTDDLVVDTVNSKVGIGTDAPAYALDVHGTANVGALTATSISGPLSGNADTATQVNNLLTPGSYLTGFAYNGGTARTFGVDATTTNTVSKVVARDASGNFSAGTITATLSGVASSITNQENSATTTSTSVNTASTIVKRDASGDFSAGTITATLSGVASSITNQENSATTTSTSANTANTIVKRDANGDFSATSGTFSGTLRAPGVPVQFVSAQVHDKVAYSSAALIHIDKLDISIAPHFSNSKIYLTWRIEYECHNDVVFRIYRNSTLIGYNTSSGNEIWSGVTTASRDNNEYSTPAQNMITWTDSPDTTSTVTYKVYARSTDINRPFYLNRTLNSTGSSIFETGVSQKTAMEIAQ
jgi:hypothetical protein